MLAGTRPVCVPLCSGFGARARVGAKCGIRDLPIHPSLEYAVRVACSWCAPPTKFTAVVTVSVLPLSIFFTNVRAHPRAFCSVETNRTNDRRRA